MFKLIYLVNIIFLILIQFNLNNCQRTALDDALTLPYRQIKRNFHKVFGRTGGNKSNTIILNRLARNQRQFDISDEFFCDAKNGPGRRSDSPPTSVHRLRPGDIDIIGALGDSLTAGNGIMSTRLEHVFNENRGIASLIGGQGDWRQYLTIPNILKEFNPNLYGYPISDSWGFERASKFNVAEGGAISSDIPYEAKILVKRLKSDPKVNMTAHWKMINIFIGANDFCTFFDVNKNPKIFLDKHAKDMLRTLRYLRDNVPRLLVVLIPGPDVRVLKQTKNLPAYCSLLLPFLCPNFFGANKEGASQYFQKIILDWQNIDRDIANLPEFNTDTFSVSFQHITVQLPLNPKTGNTDPSFLATDCFHLSQKSHAFVTNTLWNNMLEDEKNRDPNWILNLENFKCPTDQRPYLSTKQNYQL